MSVSVKGCTPAVESGRRRDCRKIKLLVCRLLSFCIENRCGVGGIQVRGEQLRTRFPSRLTFVFLNHDEVKLDLGYGDTLKYLGRCF